MKINNCVLAPSLEQGRLYYLHHKPLLEKLCSFNHTQTIQRALGGELVHAVLDWSSGRTRLAGKFGREV